MNLLKRRAPASHRVVVFVHIPKTAGTTLTEILKQQCAPDEFLSRDPIEEFLPLCSPDEIMSYRVIRAHFGYNLYEFLPFRPILLTMLRNPVEQVISHYAHLRRMGELEGVSLDEAVTTNARAINNLQTRLLSRGLGENPTPLAEYYAYPGEVWLDMAKMHLHDFAWFGIQEQFDASLDLLAAVMNWEIPEYEAVNIAPDKPAVSQSTIELIEHENRHDIALYEYGLEIFRSRVRAM